MPVLDTNSLRESALRASWQRDQRVARRRLAIRWTLWWLWKYKHFILAALLLLAGLVYLLHRNGLLPTFSSTSPAVTDTDSGLPLRLERQLPERSNLPASKRTPAPDAPTPLQLKPDSQLKTKESSP
ncbi:MAG: hypothetical protein WB821_00990 [Burkholderiaceae bacterium]